MLISVLMPARNAAATLPEALHGLRNQRGAPPTEIVCVDDASTDATGTILEEANVEVVKGHGAGLVAALNLGLAHCKGDLVARMDADDLVHPDRLKLQAGMLAGDPSLGAVGSLVECDAPGLKRLEKWLNQTVSKEQCRNARFIEAPLVHPSTTFRREALAGGWQDNGWAEDWDLLLRLVEDGWELAKVPRQLLVWRDSPHRLTRTHDVYAEDRMFRLRAHYLARGPLKGREFDIWGAGPTGKRLARELEAHGLRPRTFFDVDRKKQRARGRPVLTERELPPPGSALMLCAVGAAGAREEIRSLLEPRGYAEGRDFLFTA
ncbi:MAG: glycosyltransferase [Myxococcales bacterium]|nr:glycosyltransferase [Myxococcales bacterium]